MFKFTCHFIFISILAIAQVANAAYDPDIIKVSSTQSKLDKRALFKNELLKRTMEVTQKEYGAYEFVQKSVRMNRPRALQAIMVGEPNNVYIAPSKPEWNEKTIAIKVPIRMGLLSYRILLVHKEDLSLFDMVQNADDLKKLIAGVRSGWVTTSILQEQNYRLKQSQNFDGLFFWLDTHRVNYIPRSIYEAFDEVEARKDILKNVVIEPNLVLHLPTSTYIYVSPKEPRLAERIEKGINIMFEKGELKEMVDRYYKDDIERANLKNRRVIPIENPFYLKSDQVLDAKYWYQP